MKDLKVTADSEEIGGEECKYWNISFTDADADADSVEFCTAMLDLLEHL